MENKMTRLPIPIIDAIEALLKPYNINVTELLNQHEEKPAVETLQKKFLTCDEATRYCGIGRWSLWDAHRKGKIKAAKLADGRSSRILYDRASIDAWLESRMKEPERPIEPASPLSAPDESPLLQLARRVGENKAE